MAWSLLPQGMLTTIPSSSRISRRMLFKTLGLGGAAALLPSRARAQAMPASGGETATLLDLGKCIGCGACVGACRETNAKRYPEPVKPLPTLLPPGTKNEDFSDRRGDDSRLTPYNWLYIQSASVDGREVHIPRRCMHCQNPPCANLCPWGAASKRESGTVQIDPDICLGGSKCRDVCPWQIPQRQSGVGLYLHILPTMAGNGVMFKCDRCQDRVARGQLPACVEACPQGVQSVGPRDELVARARRMAKEQGGYLYGVEENGGTNTIYYSPVPFEKLNQAVAKGPGKPHLASVPDSMAGSNALAWAVLLAPLAGAASALLRGAKHVLASRARKENHHE